MCRRPCPDSPMTTATEQLHVYLSALDSAAHAIEQAQHIAPIPASITPSTACDRCCWTAIGYCNSANRSLAAAARGRRDRAHSNPGPIAAPGRAARLLGRSH